MATAIMATADMVVSSKKPLCKSPMLSTVSTEARRCSVHVSRQITFLVRQQHNM